jgi:hypothetical protein
MIKLATCQVSVKNCDKIYFWKDTDLLYSFWFREIIFGMLVLFPLRGKSEEPKFFVTLDGAIIFVPMKAGSEMKKGVFWDVTPCGSCKNRRFGGT